MKKSKVTRSLLAACSIVALSVAVSACVHNGDSDPVPEVVEPEPMPEPMPPDSGEVDLGATQGAAMTAAAAAMTASDAAAASAASAATATANVATLQTGEMAHAHAMAAQRYATAAMAESGKAAAANTAAQAATTGSAAGAQLHLAEAAQKAAEAAAMKAAEYAMKAAEAAGMELQIDGAMKMVGDSSVDANMGTLTDPNDKTETGYGSAVARTVDAVPGIAFVQRTTTTGEDTEYVQAVSVGSAMIGKVVDATDDMARLTIVTAREGKKNVRVFADGSATDAVDGLLAAGTETEGAAFEVDADVTVKSIGGYYMATPTDTDVTADMLDAMDVVGPDSDPVELFELSALDDDDDDATTPDVKVTGYARIVRTITPTGADPVVYYRTVDIDAAAAPDVPGDDNDDPEQVQVTASIPAADDYEHIHFGMWAGLKDNEDGDNSVLADLGIGFVQNFSGSGVSTAHVTGTAVYEGDWVAVVRQFHTSTFAPDDGHAELTANFSTDEFMADLDGLAMLEGSLSNNTFSGTDATVEHSNLDASGTFVGSFSGAIYGDDGAEAGGVFAFDGGDAGAFRGAFGGRDENQ